MAISGLRIPTAWITDNFFRDDENYLPVILSGDWHVSLIGRDWRQDRIGLGVDRCPFDPENHWPL